MKKIKILFVLFFLSFLFVPNVLAKKDECVTIQSGELLNSADEIITIGFDDWGYNYQGRFFNGGYCDAYRNAEWCQPYKEDHLVMKWNDAWLSNKDCDGGGLLDRHYGYDTYVGSGAWLTNTQNGEYEGEDGKKCPWSYFTKIVAVPEDAYHPWLVEGDWVLEFDYLSSLYIHDMKIENNIFTGTGGYPAGADPYSITWTVVGYVDGDDVVMTISYNNSSYYIEVYGEIDANGEMSGSWYNLSQSGTWESSSGSAVRDSSFWYTADGSELGPVIWGQFATILEIYNDPCDQEGGKHHNMLYHSEAPIGFGLW